MAVSYQAEKVDFDLFDTSPAVYGVDPASHSDNFAMMHFKIGNIFNCTISEKGTVIGTAWCSVQQIEDLRHRGFYVVVIEEAKNPLLNWAFGNSGIEPIETKQECLWCHTELEEPYIDPESDGSIGYNWRKYCSTWCENHNEYE